MLLHLPHGALPCRWVHACATAAILSVNSSSSLKHYYGYADYVQKEQNAKACFSFRGLHQRANTCYSQNKDTSLKEAQFRQPGAMLFKQAPSAAAS